MATIAVTFARPAATLAEWLWAGRGRQSGRLEVMPAHWRVGRATLYLREYSVAEPAHKPLKTTFALGRLGQVRIAVFRIAVEVSIGPAGGVA
jgi:hypothetical protein